MQKKLLAVFAAILPLLILGFVYLYSNSGSDEIKKTSLTPSERFTNGRARTKVRYWEERGIRFREICSYGMDAKELTCGVERAGKRWEGRFSDWYDFDDESGDGIEGVPYRISSYGQGKPDGVWRTFWKDGKIQTEIVYKNGEKVSWSSWAADGSLLRKKEILETQGNPDE